MAGLRTPRGSSPTPLLRPAQRSPGGRFSRGPDCGRDQGLLHPRFPLFGGWKTHYAIGYNVPGYEYLFFEGDDRVLNMRLVDHIFDDMLIESASVKGRACGRLRRHDHCGSFSRKTGDPLPGASRIAVPILLMTTLRSLNRDTFVIIWTRSE